MRRRYVCALLLLPALVCGCASFTVRPILPDAVPFERDPANDTVSSAVMTGRAAASAEQDLADILDEAWELMMVRYPSWATYEGDRRFDDRVYDASPAAAEAYLVALEGFAARAQAIDPRWLSALDRDTQAMLIEGVRRDRAVRVCRMELWGLNGLGGPQVEYPGMPVFFPIRDAGDLANLRLRYEGLGAQIDQIIANLQAGLDAGYVTTQDNALRVIEQVEALLETPIEDDPMLTLQLVDEDAVYDTAALQEAVEGTVRPALQRFKSFVEGEVLPAARERVGVSEVPDGAACYAALVASHIGEGFDPEQLAAEGMAQLEWAHEGMREVASDMRVSGRSVRRFIRRMTGDRRQFTDDGAELLALNEAVVARAQAAMGDYFGRVPQTPVEVWEIEAYRAADAPAAYYYGAPEDGSRPGIYYVNIDQPDTRPLYNLEALAFHEAIPGHHLQIALTQELPEMHVWRRNQGQTAFTEGWALYAEVLADEMGLYSTPAARFGMYNYQAWRAARLVVDTGMHAMGWSRREALEFMLENTAIPRNEAENEIDRYIAWPGQALAYMVGRLEIQSLRQLAETRLGDRFDLSEFHDRVLGQGSVPLTILRVNIERWLDGAR